MLDDCLVLDRHTYLTRQSSMVDDCLVLDRHTYLTRQSGMVDDCLVLDKLLQSSVHGVVLCVPPTARSWPRFLKKGEIFCIYFLLCLWQCCLTEAQFFTFGVHLQPRRACVPSCSTKCYRTAKPSIRGDTGLNPWKVNRFFSFPKRPGPAFLLSGVQRPRPETDLSPASSAEVRSEWSSTSTPLYAFRVRTKCCTIF
jgi:hypothetical protein